MTREKQTLTVNRGAGWNNIPGTRRGSKRRIQEDDQFGFTLIEVLVVVIILGILASIVVFAVGSTETTSKQAACSTDAKSVETALEAYKSQNGTYPTPGSGNPSTFAGSLTYYSPITSTSNGGPWLRTGPSSTHYEVWFNSSGQVYVTAAGTSTDPGDNSTNDFDISNPNVCTTSIVH